MLGKNNFILRKEKTEKNTTYFQILNEVSKPRTTMPITCPNAETEYKNILQAHSYRAENTKNLNPSSKWLENT